MKKNVKKKIKVRTSTWTKTKKKQKTREKQFLTSIIFRIGFRSLSLFPTVPATSHGVFPSFLKKQNKKIAIACQNY
jgi:hypothetical protein